MRILTRSSTTYGVSLFTPNGHLPHQASRPVHGPSTTTDHRRSPQITTLLQIPKLLRTSDRQPCNILHPANPVLCDDLSPSDATLRSTSVRRLPRSNTSHILQQSWHRFAARLLLHEAVMACFSFDQRTRQRNRTKAIAQSTSWMTPFLAWSSQPLCGHDDDEQ